MKILVFGNPLLKNDCLPLKLIPELQKAFPKIKFVEFDPTENLEKQGKSLYIIDTIKGIDKVIEIRDLNQISKLKVFSMHDFDLGYNLKILQKLKIINSVRIIGVPMKIKKEEALDQIQAILRKWEAQFIQGS